MLRFNNNLDLKELEKFGFKRVEFRKCFHDYVRSYQWETKSYIDLLDGERKLIQTDTIIIHDVDSVCYTGRVQVVLESHNQVGPFNELMGVQDKTLEKLFELTQAGLLEIVDENDL